MGTPWGEPRIEDCVFDRCRRKGFIHHQADLINCRFIGKMNGCIWNGTSPVHRRGRRNLIHGNDFSKAIIAPDPAWRSGLQLRRGGRPRDLARQGSSWDAHASIDVLLLCGAGLAKTKQYLAERSDGEAHAAHEYLLRCEAAADFEGFTPARRSAWYDSYYGVTHEEGKPDQAGHHPRHVRAFIVDRMRIRGSSPPADLVGLGDQADVCGRVLVKFTSGWGGPVGDRNERCR